MWAPVKPDKDNIDKNVYDALRIAWRDDAQICAGNTFTAYAEMTGKPRVVVRLLLLRQEHCRFIPEKLSKAPLTEL